ncbi:MAG: glycosyltransferase family 2 protein, partial [Paracoccaceae bacterium]
MSQLNVSFLILTYNQVDFVENALSGAFSQTYSPLEIVISDDASTDGTREKIKEMVAQYSGPHSV